MIVPEPPILTPAQLRIGGAPALASADDIEVRQRVQTAVDRCATPALREALEEAHAGQLEESTVRRALPHDGS